MHSTSTLKFLIKKVKNLHSALILLICVNVYFNMTFVLSKVLKLHYEHIPLNPPHWQRYEALSGTDLAGIADSTKAPKKKAVQDERMPILLINKFMQPAYYKIEQSLQPLLSVPVRARKSQAV